MTPGDEESLQAWFDANDSNTINTHFVKKWKDRANENDFQTELLKRPALIENALNNLPVIDFDGDADSLEISQGLTVKILIYPFLQYRSLIHFG